MPFIPASTSKIEEMATPGKGLSIHANSGSVEAQIERSTYLIAQRLGCSPQAIQRLAGIPPTSSNNAALASAATTTTPRGHGKGHSSATTNGNTHNHKLKNDYDEFEDPSSPSARRNHRQHHQDGTSPSTARNPMMHSVKKEIDDIKPMSLPPLPAHLQNKTAQRQEKIRKEHEDRQKHGSSGSGGLTLAQQQAAFLDDAEAARQFAAQLRFRDAMLQQRKGPSVGQYNIPEIIGASNPTSNIYTRSAHVSLDGQTPRSGRFMFNIDLFENGAKRPGPGEYDNLTGGSSRKATIAGRDRGMRKKLPIERVNARMPLDAKSPRNRKKEQQQLMLAKHGGSNNGELGF